MNIEDEVRKLKHDNFWLKVILFLSILNIGILAVGGNKVHSKLTAKTAEIANKANVECVTKTNTLFGVMTKIKLVK